jgi:hypothetical protein
VVRDLVHCRKEHMDLLPLIPLQPAAITCRRPPAGVARPSTLRCPTIGAERRWWALLVFLAYLPLALFHLARLVRREHVEVGA